MFRHAIQSTHPMSTVAFGKALMQESHNPGDIAGMYFPAEDFWPRRIRGR